MKKIGFLFIALVLFASAGFAFVPAKFDSPKNILSEDENFNKTFREGRELIDKEEWSKAAEKFNRIVCDCPEKPQVDAAFYWLAFCYKKQKMFTEMDATIDRLLKNFPNSSWADDARVMKYDRPVFGVTATSPRAVSGNYPTGITAATIATTTSQTPLEREDEIKLAAFQSLLSAEPKRAVEVMGDILKPDSKASESLKREIIRSFRMPRFGVTLNSTGFYSYENSDSKSDAQYILQLRETLVKSYQNDSNIKIRTEIIYAISAINDEESMNYLVRLYAAEQNKELKKAIINSFGGLQLFTIGSTTNVNGLKKGGADKLLEIIRTEKDAELRRLALSGLQRFSGWSDSAESVEMLSQIYDAENDEEFKLTIIRSLAASKQNAATNKLMKIAKNDNSDKMRLEAIRSLRTSKNPEVIKFLEDLIK